MKTSDVQLSQKPLNKSDLFWTFTRLALQGFGGVLAVAERVLVEQKRWQTKQEFLDDWAVSQVLPGPNIVNMSIIIGSRHHGVTGGLAALAGMLALPLLIVCCLAAVYSQFSYLPQVSGALRGMSAVSAGLIMGAGLRLVFALKDNAMGPWVCGAAAVVTFVLVAVLRIPQIWVLLLLGGALMAWAWRVLRNKGTEHKGAENV